MKKLLILTLSLSTVASPLLASPRATHFRADTRVATRTTASRPMASHSNFSGNSGNRQSAYRPAPQSAPRAAVNTPVERRIDFNHDGRVQGTEVARFENRPNAPQNSPQSRPGTPTDNPRVDQPWEAKADKNNDGFVDRSERPPQQGPQNAGPATAHNDRPTQEQAMEQKADVDHRWEKQFDADGDGKLSQEEFQASREAYIEKKSEVNQGWEKQADTDGDGVLSQSEAQAWQSANPTFGNNKIDNKFEARMDQNNNGILEAQEKIQADKIRDQANAQQAEAQQAEESAAAATETVQ